MVTVNMAPPDNGNFNSITINGRTYSSTPGVSIPVQLGDSYELSANGWYQVYLANSNQSTLPYTGDDNKAGLGPYLPTATAAPVLAVGFKRLIANYNGPVALIQNGAGQQQQIYFNTNNDSINRTQLYSFLGNQGGLVLVLYDQTGNENHCTAYANNLNGNPPMVMPYGWQGMANIIPSSAPHQTLTTAAAFNQAINVPVDHNIDGIPTIICGWDAGNATGQSFFTIPYNSASIQNTNRNNFTALWCGSSQTSNNYGIFFHCGSTAAVNMGFLQSAGLNWGGLYYDIAPGFADSPQFVAPSNKPMVLALNSGGGNFTTSLDGLQVQARGSAIGSGLFGTVGGYLCGAPGWVSGLPYAILPSNLLSFALYPTSLGTQQQSMATSAMRQGTTARGNNLLLMIGDSITYGITGTSNCNLASLTKPLLNDTWEIYNFGVPSQSGTQDTAAANVTSAVQTLLVNNKYRNVFVHSWHGFNDLSTSGQNLAAATAYSNIYGSTGLLSKLFKAATFTMSNGVSYASGPGTANVSVVAGTVIPGSGLISGTYAAFNTSVLGYTQPASPPPAAPVGYIDYANIPGIGSYLNPYDNVHPLPYAYALGAHQLSKVINGMMI